MPASATSGSKTARLVRTGRWSATRTPTRIPLYGVDNSEVTADWPSGPVPRPECVLIGNMYQSNPVDASLVASDASALGTSRNRNEERRHPSARDRKRVRRLPTGSAPVSPANLEIWAHSPLVCRGEPGFADMTYYARAGAQGECSRPEPTGGSTSCLRTPAGCLRASSSNAIPEVTGALTRITTNVLEVSRQWSRRKAATVGPELEDVLPRRARLGATGRRPGGLIDLRAIMPRVIARFARIGCRNVERRVAVEETEGNQGETGVLDGHDRPVLGPRDVGHAERVPDDHVLVDERAVLARRNGEGRRHRRAGSDGRPPPFAPQGRNASPTDCSSRIRRAWPRSTRRPRAESASGRAGACTRRASPTRS